MILIDFDDLDGGCDLRGLFRLRARYPDFKVTLFTIPGRCSDAFLQKMAKFDWVQMALHGIHHKRFEFQYASYKDCNAIMREYKKGFYVRGFKPPHWRYSKASLDWLKDNDFWAAVHPDTSKGVLPVLLVPPRGTRYYDFMESSHDCWHGHMVWDGAGNALASNLSMLLERWDRDVEFGFIDDAVQVWSK